MFVPYIRTIAGNGIRGRDSKVDPVDSKDIRINYPQAITTEISGDILLLDLSNNVQQIHRHVLDDNSDMFLIFRVPEVYHDNSLTNSNPGLGRFNSPGGLFVEADNTLYICDSKNNVIKLMSPNDYGVTIFLGNSTSGFEGLENKDPTKVLLNAPFGITKHRTTKILYISDTYNNIIRSYDTEANIVEILAGQPKKQGRHLMLL